MVQYGIEEKWLDVAGSPSSPSHPPILARAPVAPLGYTPLVGRSKMRRWSRLQL